MTDRPSLVVLTPAQLAQALSAVASCTYLSDLRIALERKADELADAEQARRDDVDYRCVRGHDKCGEMYPGPECPYCVCTPSPASPVGATPWDANAFVLGLTFLPHTPIKGGLYQRVAEAAYLEGCAVTTAHYLTKAAAYERGQAGADAEQAREPDLIATLYDAIKHGDDVHKAWLKEAIANHFAGLPVPPPTGKGTAATPSSPTEQAREGQDICRRCGQPIVLGERAMISIDGKKVSHTACPHPAPSSPPNWAAVDETLAEELGTASSPVGETPFDADKWVREWLHARQILSVDKRAREMMADLAQAAYERGQAGAAMPEEMPGWFINMMYSQEADTTCADLWAAFRAKLSEKTGS